MDENVEVKQITIKIGDKEIILSPAQANELREILNKMFSENTKTQIDELKKWVSEKDVTEKLVPYPYPVPYYIPYHDPWHYDRWYVTCGSNTANLVLK